MNSTVIAVDLAKNVFEVAVSVEPGKVAQHRRLNRLELAEFFATRPPAIVVMEACSSAHFWARRFQAMGHDVRLLPAHLTKKYRIGPKTDRADTKALLEAFRNQEVKPVPIKSEAMQSLAALHCARSAWMKTRTARINEIRGHLREFGIILAKGSSRFGLRVSAAIAERQPGLPVPLLNVIDLLEKDIVELEERIAQAERWIRELGKSMPVVMRLLTIPGIGWLTATAAVPSIVDPHRFRAGRQVSNGLGLTPNEHSSGERRILGKITKRGDRYLRTLLIHGARSVLRAAKVKAKPSTLELWAVDREKAIGHNRAAVALANKLARILWAVWAKDRPFEPVYA